MYDTPVKERAPLSEFFEHGPSLWRWIKYGHGKSVPYIDPFSKDSLTAHAAPFVNKRIDNLMAKPLSLPQILQNRAVCFCGASKCFASTRNDHGIRYPGDGYVFFMDTYFTEGVNLRHIKPEAYNFYNYIYSYRNLISPALYKYLSDLRRSPIIALLYEYRLHIFKDTSLFDTFNKHCASKLSQEDLGLVLLGRLLGHPLINPGAETGDYEYLKLDDVICLLEAYTLNAVRNILFGPTASRQRIVNSMNLVIETRALTEQPLPHRFTSPSALQRYHDEEARRRTNRNNSIEDEISCSEYTWPDELVYLVNLVSDGEWRIPVRPDKIKARGRAHHNCIGAYVDRHFNKPNINESAPFPHKKLLVFSDEAEAEIHLYFAKPNTADNAEEKTSDKALCVRSKLIQCKTMNNEVYPSLIPERLCATFIGCEIDLFEASELPVC